MNEVDAPAESEADSVSVVGAGGGNVTESYGNVISLAKKFGMRKEEIPVLVKTSKPWDGISIEDLSDKYAKFTPGYDQEQRIMDAVISMFDSWAIPQGREVINYYMPLEYGFDRIIELCDEKIAEVMGEAGDDGILGMGRGYYYIAMKEITKGLSAWCGNYSKQAKYLASIETDAALKANFEKGRKDFEALLTKEQVVKFDASNLASGIYFYKITAGNFTDIKKMFIIK